MKRAEREYEELGKRSPEGQEILRKMFVLRLVHPGEGTEDTRRRADKADLLAVGGDAVAVEGVLGAWIDACLLTSSRAGTDGVVVDVAHEALIRQWPRLREWMDEGREAARLLVMLKQQIEEWKKKDGERGFLFQGGRLVQMEGLMEEHGGDLKEEEIEFIKKGVGLREETEQEKLRAAQALTDARENGAGKKTFQLIIDHCELRSDPTIQGDRNGMMKDKKEMVPDLHEFARRDRTNP